jgi:4-aminobutyrate aminotransferase-like enzyme
MKTQILSRYLHAGNLRALGANPCKTLQKRSFTATGFNSISESQSWINSSSEHTIWSWSAQKKVEPISMARAEGIYFWDAEGKRYTDLNSQLMCMNIGHGHPKVIQGKSTE